MERPGKGKKTMILTGVCAAAALIVFLVFFLRLMNGTKPMIVGTTVGKDDITEFYFTYDSSAYPPEFQRYKLYAENGSHYFYHEKREGNVWPLTQEHITVSGTLELSEEEWETCFQYLKDGEVRAREESTESGGRGPWLYLYWKKDKGKYQKYSFASWDKQKAFEQYCIELKAKEQNG